jgi:hypothetical protein
LRERLEAVKFSTLQWLMYGNRGRYASRRGILLTSSQGRLYGYSSAHARCVAFANVKALATRAAVLVLYYTALCPWTRGARMTAEDRDRDVQTPWLSRSGACRYGITASALPSKRMAYGKAPCTARVAMRWWSGKDGRKNCEVQYHVC